MGKGEIARNEQFLLFPLCFLTVWRTFCHFHQIQNCRLQTLSIWKSIKFVVWERVNENGKRLVSLFLGTRSQVVLKTLQEKEKMMVLKTLQELDNAGSKHSETSPYKPRSPCCLCMLLIQSHLRSLVVC